MRIKILIMTVLALSLMLGSAFAVDLAGKWAGTTEMRGQSREISFTFKADEKDKTKFTGTSPGFQGSDDPITEVKLEGDKISFSVKNSMGMVFKYSGTIKNDEMTLTREIDMSGVDMSAMMGGMGGRGGAGGPGGAAGGPPPGGMGGGPGGRGGAAGGPPPGGMGGGPGGGMGGGPGGGQQAPIVVKKVK